MHLLIATDAWHPQINGVVRSLERMIEAAGDHGARVSVIAPGDFRAVPMPTYPEIRLALARPRVLARRIAELAPTHIHIPAEGPIGLATRRVCVAHGFPFTTAFHSRLPEYLAARAPVPAAWTYRWLRWFHNGGRGVMVATRSLADDLAARGFANVTMWSRGVDTALFHPDKRAPLDLPAPVLLYVGRVAVEKSLPDFLALDLPGSKVVVGDGPARAELARRFPQARFLGALTGEALARVYASADAFVFPSRTDTFGMVLLEALASGLPVAAYPVPGPTDVLGDSGCGALDPDLRRAALAALDIPRARCRAFAERFAWAESARQFYDNVRRGNGGDAVVDVARLRGRSGRVQELHGA